MVAGFAAATIASNATGSAIAISLSILRFRAILAFFKSVDEPAVHNAALLAGGGQPRNPQRPEIAFAKLAAETRINSSREQPLPSRHDKDDRRNCGDPSLILIPFYGPGVLLRLF